MDQLQTQVNRLEETVALIQQGIVGRFENIEVRLSQYDINLTMLTARMESSEAWTKKTLSDIAAEMKEQITSLRKDLQQFEGLYQISATKADQSFDKIVMMFDEVFKRLPEVVPSGQSSVGGHNMGSVGGHNMGRSTTPGN